MKTIGQIIHQNKFPLNILNSNMSALYYETENGYWKKRKFDSRGNQIYVETVAGYWAEAKFDSNDVQTYFKNSDRLQADNR